MTRSAERAGQSLSQNRGSFSTAAGTGEIGQALRAAVRLSPAEVQQQRRLDFIKKHPTF
jgi:hypothetical protein